MGADKVHREIPPTPFPPQVVARVIKHMNEDHEMSLLAYCKAFQNDFKAETAELLSVDRSGFRVKACAGDYCRAYKIAYDQGRQLSSARELRTAFVDLHRKALSPPATGAWAFPVPVVAVTFLMQWAVLPALMMFGHVVESAAPEVASAVEQLGVGLDLAQLAGFIFYASVVAHVGEQIFAAWIAYKAKAGTRNVVLWSCLVFILGFPALRGLTLLTAGPKGKHGSGKGKEGEKEE